MSDNPSLDEVRSELAAIHEELLKTPGNDFSRRVELQDRRNALRALSSELAGDLPPDVRESLLAAFDRLSRTRDDILNQRISPASESVGDAGISPLISAAINAAIERGLGLDEVEEQIRQVVEQLRARDE